MRSRISLAAFVLLAACSGTPETATRVDEGLPAVRAMITAHNYGQAAGLARTLAERTPQDPAARFELARAEALLGNAGSALDALDAAVRGGLPNVAGALADPAFEGLRASDRFAAIEAQALPGRRPVERIAAGEGRDAVSITTGADGREVIRAGDILLDANF